MWLDICLISYSYSSVWKYSTREHVERLIQYEAKLSAVFASRHPPPSTVLFVHTSIDSALSVLLYFLVVLLGVIFLSTRIASVFGDHTISKLSYNLFVVIE